MKDQSTAYDEELRDFIVSLRENREEKLKEIYDQYREEFLKWAQQKSNLGEDDILDVFQDAVIILYKKVVSGALTTLTASIKTYLFGIAKNRLQKQYAIKSKYLLEQEQVGPVIPKSFQNPIYQKINDQHIEATLAQALEQLGERCKELLRFSFYDNYALEAIAMRMNYKNSQVVSAQIYKCLQRLKKLVIGKI